MGLFDKLFGGGKAKQQTAVVEHVECPHAVLVPRWDSVQDMGHEDKATRYMCEACHEEFSPEKARELGENIAERLTAGMEEINQAAAEQESAEAKKE